MDILNIFYESSVLVNNVRLFRASKVGEILEISDIVNIIQNFDETEKVSRVTETIQEKQPVLFLTEKGLYNLLLTSKCVTTQNFKTWACNLISENTKTTKSTLVTPKKLKYANRVTSVSEDIVHCIEPNQVQPKTTHRIQIYKRNDWVSDFVLSIRMPDLPQDSSYTHGLVYKFLSNIKLVIGGQTIINLPIEYIKHNMNMLGKKEYISYDRSGNGHEIILPLQFPALPLYSMPHSDCYVYITMGDPAEYIINCENLTKTSTESYNANIKLFANYSQDSTKALSNKIPVLNTGYVHKELLTNEVNQNFKLNFNSKILNIIFVSSCEAKIVTLKINNEIFMENSGSYYSNFVPKHVYGGSFPSSICKNEFVYVIPFIDFSGNGYLDAKEIDSLVLCLQFYDPIDSVSYEYVKIGDNSITIYSTYENILVVNNNVPGLMYSW